MSYKKYYLYKKQVSNDNGQTWADVVPEELIASGESIGTYDTLAECETTPLYKVKATFADGTVGQVDCNSGSSLEKIEVITIMGDTLYNPVNYVEIGSCVTEIGRNAFEYKTIQSGLTIPNSVTNIDYGGFYEVRKLTNVNIPNSVTSIGEDAFYGCLEMTGLTLSNNLTEIGRYAFGKCIGLTTLVIPDSVTEIGDYAFSYCSGLTSVTLSSGITSISDYTFENCTSLSSVTIPSSVTTIGRWAFYNVPLKYVILESVIPPVINVDTFANSHTDFFYVPAEAVESYKSAPSWTKYTDKIYPLAYKWKETYVDGQSVIKMCDYKSDITIDDVRHAIVNPENLTKIEIYDGCTTTIGMNAFTSCPNLTEIVIPNSVTLIGDYSFGNRQTLVTIKINSVVPPSLGSDMVFWPKNNCQIYVPSESVDAYKSATYWSDYSDNIHPMP